MWPLAICRPLPSPWPEHGPSEGHGCPVLGARVPSPQHFWGLDPVEAPRVQNQPSTSTVPPSHLLRETSRGALTAPLSAPLGFWAGGLLPAVRLSLNSKLHLLTRQTGRQCPGRCPAPWAAGQLGASWPRVLEAGAPGPAPPAAVVSRVGQALASVGAGAGAGPRLLGTGPGSLLAGPWQPRLRGSAW